MADTPQAKFWSLKACEFQQEVGFCRAISRRSQLWAFVPGTKKHDQLLESTDLAFSRNSNPHLRHE
jgi:hypothetical protein